jgi:hypothetical protein
LNATPASGGGVSFWARGGRIDVPTAIAVNCFVSARGIKWPGAVALLVLKTAGGSKSAVG